MKNPLKPLGVLTFLVVFAVSLCSVSLAQESSQPAPPAGVAVDTGTGTTPDITPEAKEALKGMSDAQKQKYLEGLSEADRKKALDRLDQEQKKKAEEEMQDMEALETKDEVSPHGPARPGRVVLSNIERILSGQFPTDISRDLRQFGYNFFDKDVTTFAPLTNVPVGPDYMIGPGDNFTINLWGRAEASYDVTVNRDGSIVLPRLGSLTVSGLTFAELKQLLLGKFREYYPNFQMSVTMGRLRSINIFIVGEAKSPGTYAISSLSTVITAMYAAGGPSKNGSLRNIKVFRRGDLLTTLDLYEFFIEGLKTSDLRLQNGDTIFIPVVGPVVGVAGNVRRPAIYEMKGAQTIGEVIQMAGGVLPTGRLQNVVVERVEGHQQRIIKSFNLDPASPKANVNLNMELKNFDVIKIYPIFKRVQQVVYLEGHVKYPREYELEPGMRLRDLVDSFDDLLPVPYLPRADIIRLVPPDLHPEIISFNLGALLAGSKDQNLPLKDMDRVIIYDSLEKADVAQVTIRGAVRKPGDYPLYTGMTVKDLIFLADNPTDRAFLEKATLTRLVPGRTGTNIVKLEFSPQKAIGGLAPDNIPLQRDDMVHIRRIPQYQEALARKVYVEGEFLFPGEYTFAEGERLSSVIQRAGGLTEEAYPFGALFLRESVKRVQEEQLRQYIDNLEEDILTLSAQAAEKAVDKEEVAILEQTLESKKRLVDKLRKTRATGRMVIKLEEVLYVPSSEYDIELRPGDRLIVNARPDYVSVLGEVFNPTALLAVADKTVGFYLKQVGGPTEDANEGQIYLVKADGTVMSKAQEGFFGLATWDSKAARWTVGGFESIDVDPGDTIIVPKQLEKYPWLRVVKDITQIMYQVAVAAGIFILAD